MLGSARRSTYYPNIDRDGVVLLCEHPAAAQLEWLDVGNNRIDADAVEALIGSPFLGGLKRLGLGHGLRQADRRRLQNHFGNRIHPASRE